MSRPVLQPSATHPITVQPTGRGVTVSIDGRQIARSDNALTLQEADYPAVQYIPLADVDQDVLRRTQTESYCPFKGDASYYSVAVPGAAVVEDAIWTYEQPYDAVAQIAGHVAFYPNKADIQVG